MIIMLIFKRSNGLKGSFSQYIPKTLVAIALLCAFTGMSMLGMKQQKNVSNITSNWQWEGVDENYVNNNPRKPILTQSPRSPLQPKSPRINQNELTRTYYPGDENPFANQRALTRTYQPGEPNPFLNQNPLTRTYQPGEENPFNEQRALTKTYQPGEPNPFLKK